jgi:transposase, IS6 family
VAPNAGTVTFAIAARAAPRNDVRCLTTRRRAGKQLRARAPVLDSLRPGAQDSRLSTGKEGLYGQLPRHSFVLTRGRQGRRIESDHGRLKSRLRPMRGLKRDHIARVIMRGHAFMQNVRRGHYELRVEAHPRRRVAAAFTELSRVI